tara:strand:+ start:1659 stop:2783 length:1125 start_codon:yes stop_codon:yes gene_type:complete
MSVNLSKILLSVMIAGGYIFSAMSYGQVTIKEKESEKNVVSLDVASLKMANIEVKALKSQVLPYFISASGEVIPNANSTVKVTTRVAAQVIQRYVQEGQHINEGQPLVTLSSVDMAKTQGELLLASQEWARVKALGKDAISAKRYAQAQVSYQHAYSTALAYGMSESEIKELLTTDKPSNAKGEFKLIATQSGTVFNINFTEGELVQAGNILLQIVDENTVWVDAKLPPNLEKPVKEGDEAKLTVKNQTILGKVIQVHHQLDEITRTRSVRIEVPNAADLLHPGQYVSCKIVTGLTDLVLTLPEDAVLKTADGDFAVYVERETGKFQQVEITLVEVIDKRAVIKGINAGTRVVVKGAFFVNSELNKKGFDAHGH